MERFAEFRNIMHTLYKASWTALVVITICTAVHYPMKSGWITYLLAAIYGLYLYFHMKYQQPTTIVYFVAELLFILLLDRAGASPLVVYLLPLLILRRAVYTREPGIYIEAVLAGAVYLGLRWLRGSYDHYDAWMYSAYDIFMIGLAAVLVQPVMQITKALQTDRNKLRIKLNKAEESCQKATELALRDGLTGLYNYRALHEHINRIGDANFTILLIDVDHFKEFNDKYGHLVGDQVLVQIGRVILESVRRSDRVFRYGGEEFAVVLENTGDEVAMSTAERVRVRVANQALESGGKILNSVTISLGVAVFRESKAPACHILEQADKALYEAKARGRNNTVFFIEPDISI